MSAATVVLPPPACYAGSCPGPVFSFSLSSRVCLSSCRVYSFPVSFALFAFPLGTLGGYGGDDVGMDTAVEDTATRGQTR